MTQSHIAEKQPRDFLQKTSTCEWSMPLIMICPWKCHIWKFTELAKTSLPLLDFIWGWKGGTFVIVLHVWGRQDPISWKHNDESDRTLKFLLWQGGKKKFMAKAVCQKSLLNQNKVFLENSFPSFFTVKGRELEIDDPWKIYIFRNILNYRKTEFCWDLKSWYSGLFATGCSTFLSPSHFVKEICRGFYTWI